MRRFTKAFIPTLPFPEFKWKWASLQCTEGLNDPVVLLGVLFRMRKLEGEKYSSDRFAKEMELLSRDLSDSVGVNLSGRTGERNLIRNSGQYWRAVGLIPAESTHGEIVLTDFGRRIADRRISQSEFASITIQRLCLPNRAIQSAEECKLWEKHGLKLYPLRLILSIALALPDCSLRVEELVRVVIPLSASRAEVQDYVNYIEWYRQGTLDCSRWPDCCQHANDVRIAREFLLFLSNYGYLLREEGADRLKERYKINPLLSENIEAILASGIQGNEEFDVLEEIASDVDKKRVQSNTRRPHQARFRKEVLAACARCVISNVTMHEVLEAAHIKPYKYNGADTIGNGFALRTDIHMLFDTGHLRISPSGEVHLTDRARMDYGASIPPLIQIPDFIDRENLRWRWENYNGL